MPGGYQEQSEGRIRTKTGIKVDDSTGMLREYGIQFRRCIGQNAEEAFRTAHTLKGICLNLGLDRLYRVSACLTEKLRGREFDRYEEAYREVPMPHKGINAFNIGNAAGIRTAV